jgi:multidrug efflux pump subunit AcrA (membrane-fusion protein)
VDVATVKVAVDVPEQDISYLRPGQEETITLRAGHVESDAGQTEVVGKISYVTKQSNPSSHTMRVEILVENPCDELRTGQFVNVRLRRQVIRDAIMIPLAAVIPTEGQRVVYVAEGDTARQRNVEIGIIRGTRVQVLRSPVGVGKGAATLPAGRSPTTAPAGLAVGDKLILPPGNRYVGPGQKIAVPTGAEK